MFNFLFNYSFKIFTLKGTDVRIHYTTMLFSSFLLLLGIEIFFICLISMLFVIMHEFGHIFAARIYGIETKNIFLLPIGGLALLDYPPKEGKEEFIVTICGPLVNLAIFILIAPLLLIGFWLEIGWLKQISFICMSINAVLFIFNMLIVEPMDGAKIFRSILTMLGIGSDKAWNITLKVSYVVAGLAIVLSIFIQKPMIAIIMVVMLIMAKRHKRMT